MLLTLINIVVSAVVLIIAGMLLPGFSVAGLTGALKAAIAIAVLIFLVERVLGKKMSPQGRGLVAFLVGAAVIYLAQFVMPGSVHATVFGALLASLFIGIIDGFLPTNIR